MPFFNVLVAMNVFRNDFQRFTDDINGLIKMIRF